MEKTTKMVNAVDNAIEDGILWDSELYIFTVNMVTGLFYCKEGLNTNRELDKLVFRLWKIQIQHYFTLYVYHISWNQMIELGINGLLRSDKSEGIASGVSVIMFVLFGHDQV